MPAPDRDVVARIQLATATQPTEAVVYRPSRTADFVDERLCNPTLVGCVETGFNRVQASCAFMSNNKARSSRRHFLKTSISGIAVATAGCAQQSQEESSPTAKTWSFEDDPANSGIPERFEATGPVRPEIDTRNGSEEVSTERAYEGSQSYHAVESETSNVLNIHPTEQPYDTARTGDVSVALFRTAERTEGESQSGSATVLLYENPNEEVLQVSLSDTLRYYDGEYHDITDIGYGTWVQVTVSDISLSDQTYTIHWSTDADSGTETKTPVYGPMESGYKQTVIAIDSEGYADSLTVAE